MLEHFTDSDWYQNFRMTKEAFLNLCGLLSPYVQNQNTVMKFPMPLQKEWHLLSTDLPAVLNSMIWPTSSALA